MLTFKISAGKKWCYTCLNDVKKKCASLVILFECDAISEIILLKMQLIFKIAIKSWLLARF